VQASAAHDVRDLAAVSSADRTRIRQLRILPRFFSLFLNAGRHMFPVCATHWLRPTVSAGRRPGQGPEREDRMFQFTRLILTVGLALSWAGAASALPVTFELTSVSSAGGLLPSTQTYSPPLPILGAGDVDEAAGTYSLTLGNFTIAIDLLGAGSSPDASILTTGWGQTGSFAAGVGGAVSSSSATGTVACTGVDPTFGPLICSLVPTTVAAWPPTGASGPLGAAGGLIDIVAQTFTITEPNDPSGGQIRTVYSYAFVPEPGAGLLLGAGLFGLFASGRRRA
jgi:hypothetical protein